MEISKTLVLYLIFLVRALKWNVFANIVCRLLHLFALGLCTVTCGCELLGWCWTEMFHSEGYDKCGYRCNQQFSKWKCFAKFWHLASISIQSVAIAISTVWQWNRCQMSGIHLKTIFANTLLNCTNSQDDPNSSKNVVFIFF